MFNKYILGLMLMTMSNLTLAKTIEIKVTNVDVSKGGQIIVMLFGEDGFPKVHAKALQQQFSEELASEMTFKFEIALEVFALKVLHDESGDGMVTKNWTGIYPKEGLAFSNKQTLGITGPPSFRNAMLKLSNINSTINLNIKYP